MIPPGGQTLIDLRLAGRDVTEPVLIVTDGSRINLPNHTIYCKPAVYDWTCVKGLQAIAMVRMGQESIQPFLKALAACISPGRAFVWDTERQVGGILYHLPTSVAGPASRWPWELEALAWTPWENREFARMLVGGVAQEPRGSNADSF